MHPLRKFILAVAITAGAQAACAAPLFVGSYEVNDGPHWSSNPAVYSAQEAAALLFGGLASDYWISTLSSLDPSTITKTGWYDGWGEHAGMEFTHDYKLDLGAPGYNAPGGGGTARSAYVADGLSNSFINYVWRVAPTQNVPEPVTAALVGLALLTAAGVRRRKAA